MSQQFVKMLSGKHNAGYAVEDCVVAFLRSWLFAFTLRLALASVCCISGLTTDKLECMTGQEEGTTDRNKPPWLI